MKIKMVGLKKKLSCTLDIWESQKDTVKDKMASHTSRIEKMVDNMSDTEDGDFPCCNRSISLALQMMGKSNLFVITKI